MSGPGDGEDAPTPASEALRESRGSDPPLRECVRTAIEHYFELLGDHSTSGLYQMVLAEVEAPLLEAVMRHTGNNQSRAAELLGINRTTLRKKLRTYNIG